MQKHKYSQSLLNFLYIEMKYKKAYDVMFFDTYSKSLLNTRFIETKYKNYNYFLPAK